jgi:NAD(P)-dependent dehydrogenase (short-subunit alcohol dehydrogenase family)
LGGRVAGRALQAVGSVSVIGLTHRTSDVNLNGLFDCNQAAFWAKEPNGYGTIVNIASIAAEQS